ncbi:hypothetical protein [Pseudohaliea sp.]|uniref:hypothetical protein n=1 Tax=Pseudohaliea sp. TaxID=2740289 RepID=UPI0032EB4F60
MKTLDDPAVTELTLDVERLSPSVSCLRKQPRFTREWEHVSYAIEAGGEVVLFDPPPIFNENSVKTVCALGQLTTLVISHTDFVGSAQCWKEALGLRVFMGCDEPLPGNCIEVDQRVTAPMQVAGLHLVPLPGHSEGSIGIVAELDGRRSFVAGDALAVWDHSDGRTQIANFEAPGQFSHATRSVLGDVNPEVLACCTGYLVAGGKVAPLLLEAPEPSARPYLGETGGVWRRPDGTFSYESSSLPENS